MMSGGVGLLDYDNDGRTDVLCVQAGDLDPFTPGQSRLFRNLGDGRFVDVSDRAGIRQRGYGMGCACADYDRDGDVDIYITAVGPNTLLRNNGDGTFTDVTDIAAVGSEAWGVSAAFLDFDQDGHLDLVVANYLRWSARTEVECTSRGGARDYCSPMSYNAPAMDTLYRNRGDGTFEDVTRSAGLDAAYGNGLGLGIGDFNGDGRLDIFVANDAMPNQLWINQGGGRFKDEALARGAAVNLMGMTRAGMGVATVDLLQRGQLDLFVTHLVGEGNGVFLNNTNGFFRDWISPRGPAAPSRAYTGFGLVFGDFDLDGHEDLYVANGRVKFGAADLLPADPYAEPNSLLRGRGVGEFDEVVPAGGTDPILLATSRGVAAGDLDQDGDLDLVVVNRDGPVHWLRNNTSQNRSWLRLRLLNRHGGDALHAAVTVRAGDRTYHRTLNPSSGYASSQEPLIHLGLDRTPRVDQVRVRWPDGRTEFFGPFDTRKLETLRETTGRANP